MVAKKKSAKRPKAHASNGRRRKRVPAKRRIRKWSQRVNETSDALDLEEGVFKQRSARQIALSLKRSAEHSRRRKAEPYRSAMSMLVFYINRAGKQLPASRKRTLEKAKDELRAAFGKEG
jgi:hypothetical protein